MNTNDHETAGAPILKRLAEVEVEAARPADAAAAYERNFGFTISRTAAGEPSATVGGVTIRLVQAPEREGLAALWFESDDLDGIIGKLSAQGITTTPPRIESGRRLIEIDPRRTSGARIIIFDRQA
jgi:predicted enzyme related to lactoylglutathione lyase